MLEARTLKTSPIGTICYPALGEEDFSFRAQRQRNHHANHLCWSRRITMI